MATLANVLIPTSVHTVTAVSGAKKTAGDESASTFGALLSSRVNHLRQSRSGTDSPAETSAEDNNDRAANAQAAASPTRADPLEKKREEKSADGDNDASAINPPLTASAGADAQNAQTGAPATDASQTAADPALSGSAAQALMALLAQTTPPVQVSGNTASAAASAGTGQAADNGTAAIAGPAMSGGTSASAETTDGAADSAGTAPSAARDTTAAGAGLNMTADASNPAPALTAPLSMQNGVKSAALTANSLTPDLKGTAQTIVPDRRDKPSAAPGSDSKQPQDDGGAPVAANGGGQQNTGATQDVPLGSGNSTLTLKKTAATGTAGLPPQTGALAAATSTLSAAGADVAATPAPASALISAQLGSDEWQQAIGQQVVMFSRNGQQNAELRLHPENLGSLQISMQVDSTNQMQIHLVSAHSQVRSALEDALPHLRTALAQSGISLGQSSVGSDATPNWGGSGQDSSAGGRPNPVFSLNAVAQQADNSPATTTPTPTGRTAGVDTFV